MRSGLRASVGLFAVAFSLFASPVFAAESNAPSQSSSDRAPDEMRRLACQAAQNAIRQRIRPELVPRFENCTDNPGVGQSPDGIYMVWGSFGVMTPAGDRSHSYIARVTHTDGAFGVTVLALE